MPISPGTHAMYTIQAGDSLYAITNQFGASLPAIIQANALYPPFTDPNLIYPGLKLLVPLPGMAEQSAVLHQVTAGDTAYRIAERYSVGLDMLAALNQLERPDILRVAQLLYIPAFVYEVEQGDSLSSIARKFGSSVSEIVRANEERPGFSLDLIYAEYLLIIPLPSSPNIAVFTPLPGTRIAEGNSLSGVARAFEASVLYQIRDAGGQVVTGERAFMTSAGAPAFGRYNVALQLASTPATPTGTLLVYTRSARDGSIQDLVEVAVAFE